MILGEQCFKLSNALFRYRLTPIQFTVYSFLVSGAGGHRRIGTARIHSRVKRCQDRPNGSVRQTSNAYYIFGFR